MDENKAGAPSGLTDDERRELEELRAEKAARAEREKEARERAELERLRSEKAQDEREAAREARDEAQRERGRKMMEPDEDLHMPLGQKIVIFAVAAIAAAFVLASIFG